MATARDGLELATRMGVGRHGPPARRGGLHGRDRYRRLGRGDGGARRGARSTARRPPIASGSPSTRRPCARCAATRQPTSLLDALEPLDPDTDPQVLAAIDQARAWLAFVDGRFDEAGRLAESAGGRSLGAERHAALVLAARAALWLGDGARVEALTARLDEMQMHGRAVAAAEMTLRAGAAALAERDDAGAMYDRAIASWRSLRLPLHLALCLAERRRLLSAADTGAALGGEEAEAILVDLGANGLLRAIGPTAAVEGSARA